MPIDAALVAPMKAGFKVRRVEWSAVFRACIGALAIIVSVESARVDPIADNRASADKLEVSVSIPGLDRVQQVNIKISSGDATASIAAVRAKLDSVGGNLYDLATNDGGITRATETVTKDGHVYLSAGNSA